MSADVDDADDDGDEDVDGNRDEDIDGGLDPRRAARAGIVVGAVVLVGGAVGVFALGPGPAPLALVAIGATLLGAGGGTLFSLPPATDEGEREPEGAPDGEVVSALGGGESFERERADSEGAAGTDGDAADDEADRDLDVDDPDAGGDDDARAGGDDEDPLVGRDGTERS